MKIVSYIYCEVLIFHMVCVDLCSTVVDYSVISEGEGSRSY